MGMVPKSLGCSTTWTPRQQNSELSGYRSTLRDSIRRLVHGENMPANHPDIALMLTHLTKRQAYLELEAYLLLQNSDRNLSEAHHADLRRRLVEATFLGCDLRYS